MKRLATMILFVMAIGLIGAQSVAARADVQTTREELSTVAFDPDSGEPVWIEGHRFVTVRTTQRNNGTVVTDVRINAHGAGIGLWTGGRYQFNETWNYARVDPAGLAYDITSRDLMRIISCGAGSNLMVLQTMLVSRDANGAYTFDFSYDAWSPGGGH